MSFCYRAPADIITAALAVLGRIATVSAVSRLYRSPAWPDPADPAFINAAARIESGLAPAALLAALHAVEAGFGRRRGPRNAPRTLDLDLLDYHGEMAGGLGGGPVLPHPRLSERDFVLAPLAEIAPDWRCPRSGRTATELLAALPGRSAEPLGALG